MREDPPMPDKPLDYYTPPREGPDQAPDRPKYLNIELGRGKRWAGVIGFVLLFVAVSIVLVWMFAWFTSSVALAVGVVMFLVGYMLLMGWWASRNLEGRDP
jgi:hypothetical protein